MNQEHGGNVYKYGDILDFSANINPLGVPDSVRNAVIASAAELDKYPDPYCTALTAKLAEQEATDAENIVCGNGASDLIYRIVHALRPKNALICAPTFSEYGKALSEAGCSVMEHFLSEDCGFAVTDELIGLLGPEIDICFLCSPNNPTGRLIPPELLRKAAEKCLENDIFLVCDECFMDFAAAGRDFSLRSFMNGKCVILKAFTKLYAIPGIRLGYAVCGAPETAAAIRSCGQFWSVSGPAQAAGIAALDEKGYAARTAAAVAAEREYLTSELKKIGVTFFDSAANYILIKGAGDLAERMLRQNILIRDCRNYSGLAEGFYRIAVRRRDENILLLEALRRCHNG